MDPEIIADKLEEAVDHTLYEFRELEPNVEEFGLLHDPDRHSGWFVLLCFETEEEYALATQGVCGQIQDFLLQVIGHFEELKGTPVTISFQAGEPPQDDEEYDQLLDRLLAAQGE